MLLLPKMRGSGASDLSSRTLRTSSAVAAGALLPQLERIKVTTSAISWSFSRQPKGGMVMLDGAALKPGKVWPIKVM